VQRLELAGKPRLVHRARSLRAVAGEHPAASWPVGRGQTDDQQPRVRTAEIWQQFSPIRLFPERRAFQLSPCGRGR
jgi:hypothetical protein